MSNVTKEQQRGREEMPNLPKGARATKSKDVMATMEAQMIRLKDVKEQLDRLE